MILISDTGIGIAEENLNKIFDRFYQVDSLDNQKGTGIGLALAKSIIEAHKGKSVPEAGKGKGRHLSLSYLWETAIFRFHKKWRLLILIHTAFHY